MYQAMPVGYFHAPGALLSPLDGPSTKRCARGADKAQPMPPVSMLFCAIDGFQLMQVHSAEQLLGDCASSLRSAYSLLSLHVPCCSLGCSHI